MLIIDSYTSAVILCIVTMLCWGSWANTLKLAKKDWAFPLYYWDYSIGLVLLALIFGLTMGSSGDEGQGFIENLGTASKNNIINALIGGVIFNLFNLLIVAATAIAGISGCHSVYLPQMQADRLFHKNSDRVLPWLPQHGESLYGKNSKLVLKV